MTSRQELLPHIVAALADGGHEAASIRAIATRAGVSPGAVQHHFPAKADLLNAAMDAMVGAAANQLDEARSIPDPAERLHAVVAMLVPSGPDDTVARVWLAFASRAAVDPATRARYAPLWARVQAGIRVMLQAAAPRLDTVRSDRAATELLALVDGLAVTVLAEPERLDAETAHRIARDRVAALIA